MAIIKNEITINAPVEKIWDILTNLEELEKYDPTVKKATLLAGPKTGMNAKRKVLMQDGKNWFEEKVTEFNPNTALMYELTACSFPVHSLNHSYTFETMGKQTRVKQIMTYTVKFGLLGKVLDALMIKKQSDKGIKLFFGGLKKHAEK